MRKLAIILFSMIVWGCVAVNEPMMIEPPSPVITLRTSGPITGLGWKIVNKIDGDFKGNTYSILMVEKYDQPTPTLSIVEQRWFINYRSTYVPIPVGVDPFEYASDLIKLIIIGNVVEI